MRSLRARVAVAAAVAVLAAFLLAGAVVVGTFAIEARWHEVEGQGPPAWWGEREPPGERIGPPGAQDGPPRFVRALAGRLALAFGAVLLVVAATGFRLAGVALRPLANLRAAAERVATTRDLAMRLPQGDGPEEVDALAGSLNAMLARLQASTAQVEATLEASRRFAAEAGHELRTPLTSMRTNLEVLAASPNLTAEEQRVLADVTREQARLLALLDGLQRLARGDAAEAVPRTRVDLADVVDAAVASARVRHPKATTAFTGPDEAPLDGWPDGLRLLVDNLLENACVHGRPGGRVEVALDVVDDAVVLTVDDDGPGIPPAERERVFERFVRGRQTRAPGSGLGLALVAQQARVHGGVATIGDSPLGGARVTVRLPVDGARPAR
ncbi:MAG TPA: HAMP domain-containing sensor histidine kinase [Egibacteraceae bacterium]